MSVDYISNRGTDEESNAAEPFHPLPYFKFIVFL